MAQTTAAMSFKDCKIEIGTDGSTWTDISGFASEVTLGGGDRALAEAYTFDGETAIITAGKRQPVDVTVKILYTEGVSDPFETVRAPYEAGTPLYVRWSPQGGSTGDFQYTSDRGFVSKLPYPVGQAHNGDPVMFELQMKTGKITKAAAA